MDVVALGELLIDFSITGPSSLASRSIQGSAGGAPANVLAMVSRLGGTTQFIGKVGQDTFGDYLEACLRDMAVDTSSLLRDAHRTTLAFVQVAENGERSFTFERNPGADTQLTVSDIQDVWFAQTKVFHFGSLSLTTEPARSATWHAVKRAREAGCLISFDPNLRPLLWASLKDARTLMLEAIEQADILKLSDDELGFLTGYEDINDGIASLRQRNSRGLFLVTLGDRGSVYATPQGTGYVEAIAVDPVDTTAAGDAFLGAFLYGLTRHTADKHWWTDAAALRELVEFANVAGALTTTKKGAFRALPTLQEIVKRQRDGGGEQFK
ncbi:PfkB family carbohydrate kinase [Alicyclobacillus dauci]|uniref:PfkB family carbohydrate kinase n=1 Tax=Alicyclobacillus dauci TaxID=1475485 RepID=A0ABY6Z5M3_9BACL|nr:PfkB family carbohydrate kinase [Alicyclobacillus dauci]WAH38179.1 PfkB family carbohydrate kinase [Alicyclobacillus dauci]